MLFNSFFKTVKNEIKALSSTYVKIGAIGILFLSVALVVLYAGSAPLLLNNYKVLENGTFFVFVCYLFSSVFFFLCGVVVYLMTQCLRSYRRSAEKVIFCVVMAYVFRLLWIILLFGGLSPIFAVVALAASAFFLFAGTYRVLRLSSLAGLVLFSMALASVVFICFTIKLIVIP